MKIKKSKAVTKISCAFMIAFLIMHAIGLPIIVVAAAEDVATSSSSDSSSSGSSAGSDSGDSKSEKKSDSSGNNDSGKKSTANSGSGSSNKSDNSSTEKSSNTSSGSDNKSGNTDSKSTGENPNSSTDASSKKDTTDTGQSEESINTSADTGNSSGTGSSNNINDNTNSNTTDTGSEGQADKNNSNNSNPTDKTNGNNQNDQTEGNPDGQNNVDNASLKTDGSNQGVIDVNTNGSGTGSTEPAPTDTDLGIGVTSPDLGIGTTDPNLSVGTTDPVAPITSMFLMAPMTLMAPMAPMPMGNPTITINGSDPATVTQGSTYSDAGATAVDSLGNSIPVDTVSNVDTSIIGTYSVTYTATDSAGNTATASKTVEVVAAAPVGAPTITILGSNPATVTQGNVYSDTGATASDASGNPLTVSSVSNVDTTIAGTYSVSYSATDSYGQTVNASRTVEVLAVISVATPVITILGNNPDYVTQNTIYTDPGATAVDYLGNSLMVSAVSNVDTTIVGSYAITYSATDSLGQTSTATRTVDVVPATNVTLPVITILGNNPDSVTQNATYTDPGATAVDYMGMSLAVSAVSNVDTTIPGSYTITYSATDGLGQTTTATRTVNVTPAITMPIITILGNNPDSVTQNTTYTDPGATAVDYLGNTLSVNAVSNVDTAIVGSYTITYSATDSLGNTSTATRTVDVTAAITAPVITILGNNPDSVIQNTTYTDPGATAVDYLGATLTVTAVSNVDTTIIGTYSIEYSATDSGGNTSIATRTVEVVAQQTIAPTITILGDNPVSVTINTTYTDAGATAVDSLGVPLTVTSVSNVDTAVLGSYTVTYTATDSAGLTTTATRTVNVVEANANGGTTTVTTSSGGHHHHHHHNNHNHHNNGNGGEDYTGPAALTAFYSRFNGSSQSQDDQGQSVLGSEESLPTQTDNGISGQDNSEMNASVLGSQTEAPNSPAWPWMIELIAYLLVLNLALWITGLSGLKWVGSILITAIALAIWYVFDPLRVQGWFPYTTLSTGIISYIYYFFRYQNAKVIKPS